MFHAATLKKKSDRNLQKYGARIGSKNKRLISLVLIESQLRHLVSITGWYLQELIHECRGDLLWFTIVLI